MPDEFLTVAEVASLLKLNQQTVRNMLDRGELGHVRVARGTFAYASRSWMPSWQRASPVRRPPEAIRGARSAKP
jgi:excisionase family DNA binding protein